MLYKYKLQLIVATNNSNLKPNFILVIYDVLQTYKCITLLLFVDREDILSNDTDLMVLLALNLTSF